ncbi:MAG: class I SAM-dependent methyltransferase [Beduini sp.]|uniref:class I SAM-dependent methyltransferase n=1 Tax=Beduini sp. TaxID=1922300 RepID=UPI0039A3759D
MENAQTINKKEQEIEGLKGYKRNVEAPWGLLFYKIIWDQLGNLNNKKILDYGSGFGITANYLAAKNEVTAIEPNEDMLQLRSSEHAYTQLIGTLERLKQEPNEKYDVIICHNVLEYVEDRQTLLEEFHRVLKKDGFISIVKHNKLGKIMQKAVLEYKVDEAMTLLDNEDVKSSNFGTIHLYENNEIEVYSKGLLKIDDYYGVRIFFALQNNDLKVKPGWLEEMFALERKADQIPQFRDIAFFHHLMIKKSGNDEKKAVSVY